MRKAASDGVTAMVLLLSPLSAASSSADHTSPYLPLVHQSGGDFYRTHGYMPVSGVEAYYRAKAEADAWVTRHRSAASNNARGAAASDPAVGASWLGLADPMYSPPDANGAIGPKSFVEIINNQVGIYTRSGVLTAAGTTGQLTQDLGALSDPMVLWDPHTQRFYYSILNVGNARIDWGFSKGANPASITRGWCHYRTDFGYDPASIPDYPKLGQTMGFLMIGVNFYPDKQSSLAASRSDLLWMGKPQGRRSLTTCPKAGSFKFGRFLDLRNQDTTQAFTPVPAIQTDPSPNGIVVTASDTECPNICATGTLVTVQTLRPSSGDPTVPELSAPASIAVPSFAPPANAPQQSTMLLVDTLDGRLTHAVSGFDPRLGATTVWVAHAVLGGAGSEVRWYEIDAAAAAVLQSGAAGDPSLFAFDAGISNDRTCTATACAHGDSMVLGFTTSSSTTFPAAQMVAKVGGDAQSGFVLVMSSQRATGNVFCADAGVCRWGDYGGATPDPAVSQTAPHGEVWLTNELAGQSTSLTFGDLSWNWEAKL